MVDLINNRYCNYERALFVGWCYITIIFSPFYLFSSNGIWKDDRRRLSGRNVLHYSQFISLWMSGKQLIFCIVFAFDNWLIFFIQAIFLLLLKFLHFLRVQLNLRNIEIILLITMYYAWFWNIHICRYLNAQKDQLQCTVSCVTARKKGCDFHIHFLRFFFHLIFSLRLPLP